MNKFEKLGLSSVTIDAITKKGFTKPSPIQEKTIPILMQGNQDVIGQAQTGTGKTACFGLPILEKLEENKKTQALVLCPTRELALQVAKEIDSLKGNRHLRVTAVYGGASIRDQMDELRRGVNIVVGTPGRVMDLMDRRRLELNNLKYAVLDEADEMLNMGFVDDIKKILGKTNDDKQMLLFSATMPKEILRIAKQFMNDYIIVKDETKSLATDLIDQKYYDIMGKDRYTALRRLVAHTPEFHGLVFCKTRGEVDTVTKKLIEDEYPAAAIHGEISQGQRENSLKLFRTKKIRLLIATDVAARGIDVADLNVVINYSLPQSPETYVHRIGRTGRAGHKGTAITFLMPSEKSKLRFVERIIDQKIPKGELPSIDEILASKKAHIKGTIIQLLDSKKTTEFVEIAKQLASEQDAEKAIAAALSLAFAKQLDPRQYKEVENVANHTSYSRGGNRGGYGGGNRGGRGSRGGNRGGYGGGRGRDSGRGGRGGSGRRDGGFHGGRDRRDSSRGGNRGGSGRRDSGRSSGSFEEHRSRSSGNRDSGSRGGYGGRDSGRSSGSRDSSRSSGRRDSGRSSGGSRGGFSGGRSSGGNRDRPRRSR